VARLSLGMVPAVAEWIATLSRHNNFLPLRSHHSDALRLRWYDDLDFWPRLLLAARSGDDEIVAEIHLRATLLLGGEPDSSQHV
jgi:hypothetical protein